MRIVFARAFESLRVRNYRWFFMGQILSWTGTWVQWVAQGWLVLQITKSGFALGVVTALGWLPVLLFGAWAGLIADRFDKRKLLVLTNLSGAALSLIIGVATIAGAVELWTVTLVAFLLGVVTALDNPARQTFTMEMVGRSKLTNAISLNTATFTTARVLGPAIAGVLIAAVGIGPCFLINSVSFIPVTIALIFMNKEELEPLDRVQRDKGQVREGFRYVLSKPILRTLLTIIAVVGTLEYNFQVLLPVIAKQTFGGNAQTLGIIGAVMGVGMLAGSLGNAAFGKPSALVLTRAGLSLGFFTLLLAIAPNLFTACLVLIPLGMSSMAFLATLNASLQLNTSDEMRGRVMALYFVLFLGSTPIGAPIVGWLAEAFDPRVALAVGGLATIGASAWGARKLEGMPEPKRSPEPLPATALQE